MEVHGGSLRGRPYPAITASVLLLTILLDSSVALVLSALLGVLAAAVTGLAELGAYTFLSGLAGLVVVRRGERLGHFVQAAFAMAIVNVLVHERGRAWSPEEELRLLITHGVLHVCGWDHAEPEERDTMRRLELQLLAQPRPG